MSIRENDKKQKESEMRVLIEEVKGSINVLLTKVDALVASVERLNQTTITREELKLTIEPMEARIKALESFKDNVYKVVGIIAFGALAAAITQALPGIKL